VVRTDLPSHRRTGEAELVEALGRHDPLALAEVCSRTLPVAYAVGRRLLPAQEVDGLLLAVYEALWADGPGGLPLERWVRSRTAELGLAELRERGGAPAVPSVRAVAPELPEPSLSYLDTTERTLAALDARERVALLRAHDLGEPSGDQGEDAGTALNRALRVLADPAEADADPEDVDPDGRMADWVLGLLDPEVARVLEAEVAADPVRTARVQVLRRGRRRIEGLPPTPDLGPRLVAAVLSGLTEAAGRTGGGATGGAQAAAPTAASEDEGAPPPSALGGAVERPGDSTEDLSELPSALAAAAGAHASPPGATGSGPAAEVDDAGWGAPATGGPGAAAGASPWAPHGDDLDDVVTPSWMRDDDPDEALELDETGAMDPADLPDGTASQDAATATSAIPSTDPADTDGEQALAPEVGDAPTDDGREDPYAALRDDEPGYDPDDPFADLRDPADPAPAPPDDDAGDETERPGRSGLVRLLQAVAVLALVAGGIGLGLLLGQLIITALRG
jgi:hypothetical protein